MQDDQIRTSCSSANAVVKQDPQPRLLPLSTERGPSGIDAAALKTKHRRLATTQRLLQVIGCTPWPDARPATLQRSLLGSSKRRSPQGGKHAQPSTGRGRPHERRQLQVAQVSMAISGLDWRLQHPPWVSRHASAGPDQRYLAPPLVRRDDTSDVLTPWWPQSPPWCSRQTAQGLSPVAGSRIGSWFKEHMSAAVSDTPPLALCFTFVYW